LFGERFLDTGTCDYEHSSAVVLPSRDSWAAEETVSASSFSISFWGDSYRLGRRAGVGGIAGIAA
jgi:hypothetical protein